MSLTYSRRATPSELPAIMAIIDHAKAMLKADGSPQWQDGYPDQATLKRDIAAQTCWLLLVDGQVAATATAIVADDPNYHEITQGHWANPVDPYMTIHRTAIGADFAGQHLSRLFLSNLISHFYQQGIRNFRLDTHALNQRMQGLAESFGYQHRGKIYVDEPAANHEDNARLAYELNL